MRVLEEVRVTTPLGIRFWDPVSDSQVRGGLRVAARPSGVPAPVRQAFRTASDVYAFDDLSGSWVVEVEDPSRRYLPVAFEVDLPLPYLGVFPSSSGESPPGDPLPGFYLFPSPGRAATSGVAVIRGELHDLMSGAGAAHAVVRVMVAQQWVRHGVADASGRFAVLFPYPPFEDALEGSPDPGGEAIPLAERTWDFALEVFYDPAAQVALSGSAVPEYRSLLEQPAAHVWATEPASPLEPPPGGGLAGVLTYRRELAVRTEGRGHLVVAAAAALAGN